MAVTDEERRAARVQTEISSHNVADIRRQLQKQLETYDYANRQNRALADTQLKQNSRKTSADRFEAQRDLQSAALGLMGTLGSAMNGSATGNLMRILQNRNDKENNTYWAQHQVNQDQVENEYNKSLNANNVLKRDAITSAEKGIRDIEAELAANLNNINPDLYTSPGSGVTKFNSGSVWSGAGNVKQNNAKVSGYLMPDNRAGATRNRVQRGDYFGRLVNNFNGR